MGILHVSHRDSYGSHRISIYIAHRRSFGLVRHSPQVPGLHAQEIDEKMTRQAAGMFAPPNPQASGHQIGRVVQCFVFMDNIYTSGPFVFVADKLGRVVDRMSSRNFMFEIGLMPMQPPCHGLHRRQDHRARSAVCMLIFFFFAWNPSAGVSPPVLTTGSSWAPP